MKRFYLLLTCLLSLVGGMKADELTVFDGTATCDDVPINYDCSYFTKCEFVMPGDELEEMTGSPITAMTFYISSPASASWGAANFQVFMKEVNESTFSIFYGKDFYGYDGTALSSFYGTDGVTIVYEGSLDGTQSTMTINFQTPYTYQGGNLLIGVYNTVRGNLEVCDFIGEYVYDASVSQKSPVSLDRITTGELHNFLPKTTFNYISPGGASSIPGPSGLMVSDVTTESAVLSWTSDASVWQICLNGDEEHPIDVNTNPYPLSNLQSGMIYAVKVRANYGNGNYSRWSSRVKFSTAHCTLENQQTISYVLTDTFNWTYGWRNCHIKVVHHNTGIVVAKLYAEDIGIYWYKSKDEGTLNLCCGETYDFFWVTDDYVPTGSCGYAFYDANGDEIISFEANEDIDYPVGLLGTYTVECTVTPWRKPADFEATAVYGESALLNWTENGPATSWVVAYKASGDADSTEVTANTKPFTLTGLSPETQYTVKVRPTTDDGTIKWSNELSFNTDCIFSSPKNITINQIGSHSAVINWNSETIGCELQYAKGPWYYYDNGVKESAFVRGNADNITWGIKLPAGSYDGNTLKKVSILVPTTCPLSYTITIYNDGDTAPSNAISTKSVNVSISSKFWLETSFDNLPIDNSKNLWVVICYEGREGLAAYCKFADSNPNGRWVYYNGVWYEMEAFNYNYKDYCWLIRAEIVDSDESSRNWTTVSDVTSPYTLNGLAAESCYDVRIKAIYDDPVGESEWVGASFRTTKENAIPYNVDVVPSPYSATIRWTGTSDSYKVRYRAKPHIDTSASGFSDGFENGLGKWTVVRNGGGNKHTDWNQFTPSDYDRAYVDEDYEEHAYTSHSGKNVALSRSYYSKNISVDNWLISPQIALQDSLSYWVSDDGDGYAPAHYDVYVSTTTNDISSFVKIYEPGAPSFIWTKHAISLKDYNGTMGYIAFRHTDDNGSMLFLDDVAVGKYVSYGLWNEIIKTEPYIRLTGLNSETPYEFQIIGYKSDYQDAESDIITFTTMSDDDFPEIALYANQDNSTTLATYDGKAANVTVNDLTLRTDNTWNTLCLPFSIDADGMSSSPLEGFTIKELDIYGSHNNSNAEGTVIDLYYYDDYTGFDVTPANLLLYLTDANGIEAGKPYLIRKQEESVLYNVTYTATAGSDGYTDQSYDGLVDGTKDNYNKKWCTNTSNMANGVWFCEFNVNTPVKVTGYVLTSAEDAQTYPLRNPVVWTLKAKRNASDAWITIDSRHTLANSEDALPNTNATDKLYNIAIDKQGVYQYFRYEVLSVMPTETKMQLYELKLKGFVLGQGTSNPRFTDVIISSAAPTAVMSKDKMVSFQGTYNPIDFPANDLRTLLFNSDGTIDYPHANTALGCFQAYLHAAASPNYKASYGDTTIEGTLYSTEPGDVNQDGYITFADVNALVNIVLGKTWRYRWAVTDVNGDDKVSIADVTALVNLILGR